MRKLYLLPLLIVVFLIIVFLLAGTPPVLNYVKQKAATGLADVSGIPLVIGRLRGNLFYGIQLEDIDFGEVVQIDKLVVTHNPFRLLSKELDIKSVRVSGLRVDLDRLPELMENLPKNAETGAGGSSAFVIRIGEFSIENSGFFGKLGSTPLEVSLATRGNMLRNRFTLDSLRLVTGGSWIMVKGSIPLSGEYDLALGYELDVSAEDIGIHGLRGKIRGQGSVGGKFSAIELHSLLELAVRYLENEVSGVVKVDWIMPDIAGLQLDARLMAMTRSFKKEMREKDSSELHISLKNKYLDGDIHSSLGSIRIRGNLQDDITKPYFRGVVEGDFHYLDFEPSFNGRVHYENDSLRLSDFALVSRRVAMDLSLLLNVRTTEISNAQVELSCSDLSVWNTFISAPANMAGELWCNLNMWGSLDNPQAVAEIRITDAEIYGEKITGVDLDLSLSGSIARLDSGLIHSERGEIALAGQYDTRAGDFTASLYTDGVVFKAPETFGKTTLPMGGTLGLDLAAQGNFHAPRVQGEIFVKDFVYDTLYYGDYNLECQLNDDSLQFSFRDEKEDLVLDAAMILGGVFPCTADLKLRHYALDRYIAPATGYVTARISAEGALAQLIDASGTVRIDTMKLLVEGQPVENRGAINAQLQDRIFHLQSCEVAIAGQNLYANGSMPLEFAAGSMDITASSGQIQLGDIAYLLPRDPAIRGLLRFDLRVQGTPKALDVDGMLSLTDASYKADDISIDSVNGLVRFKNGLATVDRLAGKVNKGRFDIIGFADVSRGLLDTMLLNIKLVRIDYANKDFGYVVCSADLQAGAKKDSLRISGEVVINEAAYTAPMRLQTYVRLLTNANRPAPQQPEIAKRIYCDIGIVVPDSIVIDNNVADLAVKADLQLKGYLARLNAYGTVAALDEGTIHYLGKKFTITNAVIQFDDPYKIDPVIDLTATTTIAAADGDYEIFLLLDGTVTTWQLALNSNPPLPEQDIVSLILIGQRRPGAVGGVAKELDLKGKVRDYALDMIRHNIEKTTEEVLGLDKFTLTGDLSDPSTMRIGIEKSIVEGFRLHYSTGVESWELYQVGASYDLTNKISVFTLYDQENRNTSVDLEYHLKIK
jgi:hypothetical protein